MHNMDIKWMVKYKKYTVVSDLYYKLYLFVYIFIKYIKLITFELKIRRIMVTIVFF